MNTYQLWDNPSATLLAETSTLQEIASVVQAYIDQGGLDVLEDLSLSIEQEHAVSSFGGFEVMLAIQAGLAHAYAQEHQIPLEERSPRRRRWLLRLMSLQTSGYPWDQMRLIKAAFLLKQRQDVFGDVDYRFFAHNWGPFSGEVYDDLKLLAHEGVISVTQIVGTSRKSYELTAWGAYWVSQTMWEVSLRQQQELRSIAERLTSHTFKQTLRDLYAEFPEYAVLSRLTDR